MEALLAKAKALRAEGLSAFIWCGGYDVPPKTLTGSIQRDMLLVDEVIGAGEIAIADRRSTAPTIPEIARIVKSASVGGTLTGKAGVTHFHVGEEPEKLSLVRELLDSWGARPEWLHPTHVERNEALMLEAIALTQRGVTVDIDTVERDLPRWLTFFRENGGDLEFLTVSSDAAVNSPMTILEQMRCCLLHHQGELSSLLPLVTTNPARVLKLGKKGRLAPGMDADVAVLDRYSLELRHVVAQGRHIFKNGRMNVTEPSLTEGPRSKELYGEKR